MWGNGVAFSMLVSAAELDPKRYQPTLALFFSGLEGYWDRWAARPGYDAYLSSPGNSDKYYDDNAWMVLSFVEAYTLTKDQRYLDRAVSALRFVLSGWDDKLGGGIYWREDKKSKNTCSNGPSAMAALAVAQYVNTTYFTDWARRIVVWTQQTLQDTDGLYEDNCALDGKRERTKWTYNTALMLRANLGLWKATGEKRYLTEAQRLAVASERVFVNPETGAFRDDALFSHLLCEAFLELHATTHEPYLKKRAEACGAFCWKTLRDPKDGGHWTEWKLVARRSEARKTLIANAATARLYGLLARA